MKEEGERGEPRPPYTDEDQSITMRTRIATRRWYLRPSRKSTNDLYILASYPHAEEYAPENDGEDAGHCVV
jgi:hypothetical protein